MKISQKLSLGIVSLLLVIAVTGCSESSSPTPTHDSSGFNPEGTHKDTGTPYGPDGYSQSGFNQSGFGRDGNDREGYNADGMDRQGQHRYRVLTIDQRRALLTENRITTPASLPPADDA